MFEFINGFFRRSWFSRLLAAAGIDSRQYWLLVDLFQQLSERREFFSQLGTDGVALKTVALMYGIFAGLGSMIVVSAGPAWQLYLAGVAGATAFVLFTIMVAEIDSSLMNPAEGVILAHQPIGGATYISAKLTHLVMVLLYLVPATNVIPAIAGMWLKDTGIWYPFLHLAVAAAAGLAITLFCCATFGWLLRVVPASRLKAAGQLLEIVPWLAISSMQPLMKSVLSLQPWWSALSPPVREAALWTLGLFALAGVAAGLRSLSLDYLTRVTNIQHHRAKKPKREPDWFRGWLSLRRFLGPQNLAGFDYLRLTLVRDWQFRKQLLPLTFSFIVGGAAIARGLATDPFSSEFSAVHIAPHLLGVLTLVMGIAMRFGSNDKAVWFFQVMPEEGFLPFARGTWGTLTYYFCLLPHLALLSISLFLWSAVDALLFGAFSFCVTVAYASIAICLIRAIPFSKRIEPAWGAALLPMMLASGLIVAGAIAFQYFVLFRSRTAVIVATGVLALSVFAGITPAARSLYASIRYQLSLLSAEAGDLYREVDS